MRQTLVRGRVDDIRRVLCGSRGSLQGSEMQHTSSCSLCRNGAVIAVTNCLTRARAGDADERRLKCAAEDALYTINWRFVTAVKSVSGMPMCLVWCC
jgi:hypothetical protein